MPTPRNQTFTTQTGGTISGGRYYMPTWRRNMAPFTWTIVPTSNTLMSIDPASRPDLNPNGVGSAPWRGNGGFGAILDAYGSLQPSRTDGNVYAALFGGHGDYAGNESVGIDLKSENPAYRLIRRPSGSLPDSPITYMDGQESTGVYSDGRIRSIHPYNNLVHLPNNKMFLARVGASYYVGNVTSRKCFYIDCVTGEHELIGDYSSVDGSLGSPEGGACYDSLRNCVWHIGNNGSSKLLKTDLNTGVTTSIGGANAWVSGRSTLIHLVSSDLIAMITTISGGTGLMLVNPTTGAAKRVVPISGTPPTGWSGAYGYSGASWSPELGGIAMWDHDSNTAEIALLTPPADMWNGTWTIGSVYLNPVNSVTPTTRISSSIRTDGKFGYLPAMKGFYLQNRTSDPMYFFSLG